MKNKNLKNLLAKMQEESKNQEGVPFENLRPEVSDKIKGGYNGSACYNRSSCR